MSKKAPKISEMKLKHFTYPDRFGEWLGYQLIKGDRKNLIAEAGLKIREDHLSPAKRVHGGVISAFLDYVCGAAVFLTLRPKDFCSTVELKVNYLLPIELGDQLRATAQIVFRGRRLCVLQSFVYRNGSKQPVAMASATYNVVVSKEIANG